MAIDARGRGEVMCFGRTPFRFPRRTDTDSSGVRRRCPACQAATTRIHVRVRFTCSPYKLGGSPIVAAAFGSNCRGATSSVTTDPVVLRGSRAKRQPLLADFLRAGNGCVKTGKAGGCLNRAACLDALGRQQSAYLCREIRTTDGTDNRGCFFEAQTPRGLYPCRSVPSVVR
jgi:hypothetical protein